MRTRRGWVLAALAGSLAVSVPSHAATFTPVGGELLATHGTVVAAGAPALPRTVSSSWLVADLDTGQVLGTHDPHGRYAPASTLKTLTAETLIPQLDPERFVFPTWDDVNVDGSRVGLVQSVRYRVRQLFTAMLVVSGNDAANTLATANGGIPQTVAQMNAEAVRLKADDTHAVNANGLDDPKQLSSAYDLALIARAGMQLPDFRSYVATKHAKMPGPNGTGIAISTHDKLLYNYPGAIGIKNGYTVKARATFVGAATRDGHTLVVTMMKTEPHYWPEAAALLDWGFAAERAGAEPVGQLVDPDPTPEQLSAQAAQAAQSTVVRTAASRAPVATTSHRLRDISLVVFGSLASPVVLLRLRQRRRLKRRRLARLSLPRP